ncbi:hypothetical protein KTE54_23715 [Burkholderia multivorans]|uniref:hypothetical protein n=1 Tax=Burkholderia multivorans TaxID=87883 RepID=UPI001C25BF9E|nr:hypothetical protein [Burkholderia multivorans]MBU9563690.1 hypothetical protein [Burkholderia multivorans]
MDERYIKRPERVRRAMEQLWSSFVDCTINAPEALALHQYVTSLEKAANRTTPDRDAIIEECASYLDRKWDSAAELLRSLKTTPTAASREEGNG